MQNNPRLAARLLAVGMVVLGAFSLLIGGCSKADDAPTNTKDSKYIDSGQTAADKIGADRARAHRLPGGGKGQGQ